MVRKVKERKWVKARADFFMHKDFDSNFKATRDGRTRREWAWDKGFDDYLNRVDYLGREDTVLKAWEKKNLKKVM